MTEAKIEKIKEKPSWVKIKPAELEKIVVELAREDELPAKIGLILRDKYGMPKEKLFGKKITQILKENNVEYSTEKDVFDVKIEKLKKHIAKNKKDHSAKRALTKKLWVVYNYEKKR